MKALTYLHLQMRLEGTEIVNECFMKQVEVVPGEELPLVLIAQLATKELVVYYDQAISLNLQEQLAASNFEFPDIGPLLNVLKLHNLQYEVGHYKTYVFPLSPTKDAEVRCLSKYDPKVKAFGFDGFAEEIHAIERGGSLISACISTRENGKCGEAWVYTNPEYRHQGFAQKVVNAWAGSLLDAGKIPFYSHTIGNVASASLAGKLGLQPVFEEISITQV